ncbi:hypothetical protein AN403_5957 [Pseudomonas fluorescens]|uniref:Uncharacterized protein n=1 Tax=Pseudomonas fluorescens TaxID=294 RepID=A0A0P8ZWI5_PSEFL|nr:hypothetical protein AN403_5957 [Pseudomonas fluorescens]
MGLHWNVIFARCCVDAFHLDRRRSQGRFGLPPFRLQIINGLRFCPSIIGVNNGLGFFVADLQEGSGFGRLLESFSNNQSNVLPVPANLVVLQRREAFGGGTTFDKGCGLLNR